MSSQYPDPDDLDPPIRIEPKRRSLGPDYHGREVRKIYRDETDPVENPKSPQEILNEQSEMLYKSQDETVKLDRQYQRLEADMADLMQHNEELRQLTESQKEELKEARREANLTKESIGDQKEYIDTMQAEIDRLEKIIENLNGERQKDQERRMNSEEEKFQLSQAIAEFQANQDKANDTFKRYERVIAYHKQLIQYFQQGVQPIEEENEILRNRLREALLLGASVSDVCWALSQHSMIHDMLIPPPHTGRTTPDTDEEMSDVPDGESLSSEVPIDGFEDLVLSDFQDSRMSIEPPPRSDQFQRRASEQSQLRVYSGLPQRAGSSPGRSSRSFFEPHHAAPVAQPMVIAHPGTPTPPATVRSDDETSSTGSQRESHGSYRSNDTSNGIHELMLKRSGQSEDEAGRDSDSSIPISDHIAGDTESMTSSISGVNCENARSRMSGRLSPYQPAKGGNKRSYISMMDLPPRKRSRLAEDINLPGRYPEVRKLRGASKISDANRMRKGLPIEAEKSVESEQPTEDSENPQVDLAPIDVPKSDPYSEIQPDKPIKLSTGRYLPREPVYLESQRMGLKRLGRLRSVSVDRIRKEVVQRDGGSQTALIQPDSSSESQKTSTDDPSEKADAGLGFSVEPSLSGVLWVIIVIMLLVRFVWKAGNDGQWLAANEAPRGVLKVLRESRGTESRLMQILDYEKDRVLDRVALG